MTTDKGWEMINNATADANTQLNFLCFHVNQARLTNAKMSGIP